MVRGKTRVRETEIVRKVKEKKRFKKKTDMNVPSVGDNGTWNATNQK